MSVVWIHMLGGDSRETAGESARIIDDPRVRHFHDPNQRSGKALAEAFGWGDAVAWDIYLFYEPGSRWTAEPPAPVDFMHQLSWEPTHFRTGDDLVKGLHEAMKKLTNGQSQAKGA